MTHKKVLVSSLFGILLFSTIVISAWALSRISTAYNYAMQYAAAAPASGGSSTNLTAIIYADPEPGRPTLNIFQYVTAKNIQWRTAITDPQGNPINIDVKLASVVFQKLDEDHFVGNVKGLDVSASIGDLFNIFARADNVDVNFTFWRYMDMFPALNATGVLTGRVELSISVSILPFPGLSQVLYSYKGDRFVISYCFIKPIDVTIETPLNGERVSGDVKIRALVKNVPAITVDNVHGWIDEYKVPMQYNETSGYWEGVLQSYNVGNGWRGLNVRAEGVEWKSGQEFRYSDQDGIKVEINNPWVNSFVRKDGWLERFGDLKVNLVYDSASWWRGTGFNFWPSIGLRLTAPWDYWEGKIRFECWRIDDEYGNMLFQSFDPTLTIDDYIFGMLFDSKGTARELKCIYVPV